MASLGECTSDATVLLHHDQCVMERNGGLVPAIGALCMRVSERLSAELEVCICV